MKNSTPRESFLKKKIQEEPEVYFRHPRLATVYARQAGFDILNFLETGSSGTSLMGSLGNYLPRLDPDNPAEYRNKVALIGNAKDLIEQMPATERESGANFYGSSAKTQLTLYAASYPVMYMRQFTVLGDDGTVDLGTLETMTVDDVENILVSLTDAAVKSSAVDEVLGSQIQNVIGSVSGSDSAESRTKMIEFLKSNN